MKEWVVLCCLFIVFGFVGLVLAQNQPYITEEEYLDYIAKEQMPPHQSTQQQQFNQNSGIALIILGLIGFTMIVAIRFIKD